MHELGALRQVVKTVDNVAQKNNILRIKHVTLSVGETSGFVPAFLTKLFPVAIEYAPRLAGAKLNIEIVQGCGLQIKELGY